MKLTFKNKQDAIDFRLNVLLDKIIVEPRPIEMKGIQPPANTVEITHLERPPGYFHRDYPR